MVHQAGQPKNFGFNEDEQLLRDVAEKFFRDNLPTSKLHRIVARGRTLEQGRECRWDPELWRQMTTLGWTGVAVPERAGGLAMSAAAAAALAEQAGRAACPGPLLPTLMMSYVLAACQTVNADTALGLVAQGQAFSFASGNPAGPWEPETAHLAVEDDRLTGTAYFVQDAQKADQFVVRARVRGADSLLVVPADAPGLSIAPDAIVDLTRDQAQLRFDAVEVHEHQIVSDNAGLAIKAAMPCLLVLVSAEMCGATEWQLQTTADYARTRKQFDRTLGFFQAVKHALVDVMVALDLARALLYNAACAIDHEPDRAEEFARMAAAAAAEAAAFGSEKSVQLHGGIGFTWDCAIHLYLKRQLHTLALMGDASHHRSQLAQLVLAR